MSKQKDKCPRCKGEKSIWLGGNSNVFSPCPECGGTGEQKDKLREKIGEQLAIQTLEDESLAGIYVWQWVIDNGFVQEYLDKADKIIALIPDIEEAIVQARKEQMVLDWAQAGKDVEEGKKQEREGNRNH